MLTNYFFVRIAADVEFTVCIQFSQFMAKFDDGSCVHVPRKYVEWIVNSQRYSLASLQNDLAARVMWGSNQEAHVSAFDRSTGQEIGLEDDSALYAFYEGCVDRRLFLFIDVVNKLNPVVGSNSGMPNVASHVDTLVDWDALEIILILEDQIGSVVPVISEDNVYAQMGLQADNERVDKEKDRPVPEAVDEGIAAGDSSAAPTHAVTNVDLQDAAITVNDRIPGEDAISYDKEDPPMEVSSLYATMNEFRAAVRQHAIKGQFELGTKSSDTGRFRGYCIAEGCPWAIVARLMHDEKSVRVLTFNFHVTNS